MPLETINTTDTTLMRPVQNGLLWTYCGLVTRSVVETLFNISSDTGLLSERTKPVAEQILTFYWWDSWTFTEEQFHSECLCY